MSSLSSEVLTRLLAIQTEIAADLDLSRVMQLVAQRSHELTGANGATVEIVDGDELIYRSGSGTTLPHLGLRIKRAGSLAGLCVEQRTPLICRDSEDDPRVNREACQKVGLRSMIVVPLTRGQDTVGVLKVTSDRPRAFDDDHLHLLQLLAGFIALAMHNASAFERAQKLSLHDPLTGLPNRMLLHDRLSYQLAQLRRAPGNLAVLYMDLDGFKPINDTYGHLAGDQVLVTAARRLQSVVREADTVARLGGDEFAVLLTQLATPASAEIAAERLRGAIEGEPFPIPGGQVAVGASIGMAHASSPDRTPESLIADADTAMYTVKNRRRAARQDASNSTAHRF